MNWKTQSFCRAAARYYSTRTPPVPDLESVRALWARGRVWSKLPELPAESKARAAADLVAPGGHLALPHAGGLSIVVEGELLPDFPVEHYVEAIRKASGTISIRLNCPGGDLLAALEIHTALLAAGPDRVEILVAGLCGSAATVILAAGGDRRRILQGSKLWVHSPSDCCWGNAGELRRAADALEALLPKMRQIYGRICDRSLVEKWLDGSDHLFDAAAALSSGLGTEIVEPITP